MFVDLYVSEKARLKVKIRDIYGISLRIIVRMLYLKNIVTKQFVVASGLDMKTKSTTKHG